MALMLLTSLAMPVLLAEVGGSISGTVTDPQSLLVQHAIVTAVELNTGLRHSTSTDAKGFYSLPAMPVGEYEVTVDATGFKQYRETNLKLNASGALLVNAVLHLGAKAETVVVSSDNVVVESIDTQLSLAK